MLPIYLSHKYVCLWLNERPEPQSNFLLTEKKLNIPQARVALADTITVK